MGSLVGRGGASNPSTMMLCLEMRDEFPSIFLELHSETGLRMLSLLLTLFML